MNRRISVAAIALGFATVGLLISGNFVFNGDATSYARFVQGRIRDWLITAAFASVALVVSVPVLGGAHGVRSYLRYCSFWSRL